MTSEKVGLILTHPYPIPNLKVDMVNCQITQSIGLAYPYIPSPVMKLVKY